MLSKFNHVAAKTDVQLTPLAASACATGGSTTSNILAVHRPQPGRTLRSSLPRFDHHDLVLNLPRTPPAVEPFCAVGAGNRVIPLFQLARQVDRIRGPTPISSLSNRHLNVTPTAACKH